MSLSLITLVPETAELVLTVRDAADILNVNTKWIYDHVESGLLPCRRLDRMVRFSLSDLNEWLLSCGHGSCDGVQHDGGRLMTTEDLQHHLSVSRSWVYEARRSKHLPYFKIDGLLRFSRPMVDAWLEERAVAATNSSDQPVGW